MQRLLSRVGVIHDEAPLGNAVNGRQRRQMLAQQPSVRVFRGLISCKPSQKELLQQGKSEDRIRTLPSEVAWSQKRA